jgi:hypothetical protein
MLSLHKPVFFACSCCLFFAGFPMSKTPIKRCASMETFHQGGQLLGGNGNQVLANVRPPMPNVHKRSQECLWVLTMIKKREGKTNLNSFYKK